MPLIDAWVTGLNDFKFDGAHNRSLTNSGSWLSAIHEGTTLTRWPLKNKS
jgi:hypothetical protein